MSKDKLMKPKFVKKAGCWCVTTFNKGKQEIKWFGTEKEAEQYIQKGSE